MNATCNVEARLARWLLMCQDRIGTDEAALTLEFLSVMHAVQRTSVTLALPVIGSERSLRFGLSVVMRGSACTGSVSARLRPSG